MNAYYTGKRDPINCPANQPDPTRDYHDVPFPEGTQPKPTGEWTVYSVMKLRQKHWHEEDKNNAIAIAHNAALAAAQGAQHHMEACRALLKVRDDEVLYEAIKELQQQLAAERAKKL